MLNFYGLLKTLVRLITETRTKNLNITVFYGIRAENYNTLITLSYVEFDNFKFSVSGRVLTHLSTQLFIPTGGNLLEGNVLEDRNPGQN